MSLYHRRSYCATSLFSSCDPSSTRSSLHCFPLSLRNTLRLSSGVTSFT